MAKSTHLHAENARQRSSDISVLSPILEQNAPILFHGSFPLLLGHQGDIRLIGETSEQNIDAAL
jgi:hypothetical protein